MRRLPIFDAKNNLSAVVHGVEAGMPVTLTRHGEPVAVLVACDSYSQMAARGRPFWELYERFLREWPAQVAADGGDPFADVRSRDDGRRVEL